MLNKTTLEAPIAIALERGNLKRPSLTHLLEALNTSLYRALSSHFDVTYK